MVYEYNNADTIRIDNPRGVYPMVRIYRVCDDGKEEQVFPDVFLDRRQNIVLIEFEEKITTPHRIVIT